MNLTGVTVRQYLSYLADASIIAARMDSATGGRFSMEYMISGEEIRPSDLPDGLIAFKAAYCVENENMVVCSYLSPACRTVEGKVG